MTTTAPTRTSDPRMAALPLYEDHHRELAADLAAWCDEYRALLGRVDEPESTGPSILRALGDGGWLAFLDGGAEDYRALCLARGEDSPLRPRHPRRAYRNHRRND